MKTIIDISWPVFPGMTEYKDRNSVQFTPVKTFENDNVREAQFCMSVQTGTHIDAPCHMLKDGKPIDQLDLGKVWGTARVLDLTGVDEAIAKTDLEKHEINPHEIILLKTKNSDLKLNEPFKPNFIYLDASGTDYLVEKKINGVGIDYLGIERNQPDHPTHKKLFENNVIIIEGLRLEHVEAGLYFLVCMPLALVGVDAAPARAFLVTE